MRIPKEEFELLRKARKAARKICENRDIEEKIKNLEYVEPKRMKK